MGATAASIVRAARRYARTTQAGLARRAAIPRSVLNAYERDKRDPGVEGLSHIARAAGLELRLAPGIALPDPERAGRIFEQVLDLAEALPYRPRSKIAASPFR